MKGEPSSKTKYDIYVIAKSTVREMIKIAILEAAQKKFK